MLKIRLLISWLNNLFTFMTTFIKNLRFFAIICTLIILQGCGFKKISNETINNYQVNNFKLEGDRKIGSQLKNEIFVNSKKNSENLLSIKMEVNKKKDIKERNSSNQVTKYSITIGVDLIVNNISNKKEKKRSFSKSQDYKVEDTYSQTLKNERKVLEDLNKRLSRDIINFIIFES